MVVLQNLARTIDVGSSSYLLDIGNTRVVLDAGMHPKLEGPGSLPDFDALREGSVDAVCVTHAHLDHIGAFPVLCRRQRNAQICMTEETMALGGAMLHNSVNVMTSKRDELNEPSYPLFGHRELDEIFQKLTPAPIGRRFRLGDTGEVRCTLHPAGHILGAVSTELEWEGGNLLYTGDVHFEEQSIVGAAQLPCKHFDTLIVETTRGDYERDPDYTRQAEMERLGTAIRETLKAGGTVLIPVFAMGKTQELLVMLRDLRDAGLIPRVPVHIGGLSTKMTTIYDRFADRSHRLNSGLQLLRDLDFVSPAAGRRSGEIHFEPGRIYALSSGMMTEHTVSYRFARNILADKKNALLFVGYADPESPAGKIQRTPRGGTVELARGNVQTLHCRVEKYDFSGHAPREHLLEYIREVSPKTAFLVHGDLPARHWFAGQLAESHPEMNVIIPEPGEAYVVE